jgi:hypothetical protein
MGKGLMLEGFSGSRRVVTVLASDSTNGFNLVRLRRMVGRCHQITPCRHLARHDACVKGLMLEGSAARAGLSLCRAWLPTGKGLILEGFSGSRRSVTVLGMDTNDSTNGFNLVRLRRMVGRCHQLAPGGHLAGHGCQ